MDLAAHPPFLRLRLGHLDHLGAHLNLGALDHLEVLRHLGDLDCLEALLRLGALDHLEALLHLVALQYLNLLSQSHPHLDAHCDAVNSYLVQISFLGCHTCKICLCSDVIMFATIQEIDRALRACLGDLCASTSRCHAS